MAEAKAQVKCRFCSRMADPEKVPGEGDIICVQCGLNLLTGQHIHQQGIRAREAAPKPKRRIWLYALPPAFIVLAAAAIAVGYFLTKDPVADATALAAAGNTLEATHLLDTYLAQRPEDTRGLLLRGKLHWRAQDYAMAASDFTALLSREPKNVDAAALAMLAVSRSPDNAQRTALYQQVLEAQPDNATAQRLLALTQGASGNLEEQVAAIERLSTAGTSDAFLLQMRGAALALLGRRSEAELSFTEADKAGDTGGLARLSQGLLASMNGDESRAEELLGAAQGAGPEVAGLAAARLGLLHLARGEYEPALALLRKATEADTGEDAPFFHALCLKQLRLTQEAVAALTAIRDKRGAYAPDAALELALMALDAGVIEDAEENLRQAQGQGGPTSAKLLTVQGKLYLARGEDIEAQQTFRQAIQTNEAYAPAHLENGVLYVKRGLTEEGIESLKKYLELAGDTVSGGVPEVRLLLTQLEQTAAGANVAEAATQ